MSKFVYIIHGYDSAPNKNWFIWLSESLLKINVKSKILSLPNPASPEPKEWLMSVAAQVDFINEDTYFVAHSLGTLSVLHFLQNLDSKSVDSNAKIGGYILVSGFCEHVKGLEMLDSFVDVKLNFDKLRKIAQNRLVISARDDSIVPTDFSYTLAQRLDSDFIQTRIGGHFMQTEGYTKMPLILEQLKRYFCDLY